MKDRLLIAAMVGVGFLATLGVAAVRGELWESPTQVHEPAPAPVQAPPEPLRLPEAPAATPLQPPAPEVATSQTDAGPEATELAPAPTYEQQTAERDRAAAHSARSR
jgi:hypothetical protein